MSEYIEESLGIKLKANDEPTDEDCPQGGSEAGEAAHTDAAKENALPDRTGGSETGEAAHSEACGAKENTLPGRTGGSEAAARQDEPTLTGNGSATNESKKCNPSTGEVSHEEELSFLHKDALESKASLTERQSAIPGQDADSPGRSSYHGLVRHQLVVGACLLFSIFIVSLSAFDLIDLISREATLDTTTMRLVYEPTSSRLNEGSEPASEGLKVFEATTWQGRRSGYKDESGKIVIPAQFAEARGFHEGLAAVKPPDKNHVSMDVESIAPGANDSWMYKWGFADKAGNMVIQPQYLDVDDFKHGVAAVLLDRKTMEGGLIDKRGNLIVKTHGKPERCGDLWTATQSTRCGLIDAAGRWRVPPTYSHMIPHYSQESTMRASANNRSVPLMIEIRNPEEDVAYFLVEKGGLWGILDKEGKQILPPAYEHISSFANGHAAVRTADGYGFVNAKGKEVIKPRYEFVTAFDQLIAVWDKGEWHSGAQLDCSCRTSLRRSPQMPRRHPQFRI